MQTAQIELTTGTWTEVLNGEGFVVTETATRFLFADASPADDEIGFYIPERSQVSGDANSILWAKPTKESPVNFIFVTS